MEEERLQLVERVDDLEQINRRTQCKLKEITSKHNSLNETNIALTEDIKQ